MAGEDEAYIMWLSTRRCCVEGCERGSGPPHHRKLRQGKGQRAHDHEAMPICVQHHQDRHALAGPFRGWTRVQIRAWEQAMVDLYRALYLRRSPCQTKPTDTEQW